VIPVVVGVHRVFPVVGACNGVGSAVLMGAGQERVQELQGVLVEYLKHDSWFDIDCVIAHAKDIASEVA